MLVSELLFDPSPSFQLVPNTYTAPLDVLIVQMLLQLHILLPPVEGKRFDDVFDLVYEGEFFVPDDGQLLEQTFYTPPRNVDTELQTCLFEDRSDNLDGVNLIYDELVEIFPEATVFKYRKEETIGEYRSVADPDEHIILYVGNSNLNEPRIRWRHERSPYEVSPRVANNRVVHASRGCVFALDDDSGDLLWEHDFDQVVSRPEVRGDFVVAAGAFCIRGLDGTTGEQVWHIDFDETAIEMIESRAEVGPDYVYLGTRAGDVLQISKASGEWSVLHEFSDSVYDLKYTDSGILVGVSGDGAHAIDGDGSIRWSIENGVSFGPVRDGILYGVTRYVGKTPDEVVAVRLTDGAERWAVEAKRAKQLSLADETVLAPTQDGVLGLNREDGNLIWQNDVSVNSAVPVSPTVIAGISDDTVLQLFTLDDGELITSFSFGGTTQPPVATDTGAVFVTGPELVCLENFPET